MKRLLVTGSRDWGDYRIIRNVICRAVIYLGDIPSITLVHGDCRGDDSADELAERFWRNLSGRVDPIPANWPECGPDCNPAHRKRRWTGEEYCPTAGLRRNSVMVARGAHLCLSFIRNNSPGATDCTRKAEAAEIPTWRYTK